MTPELFNDDLKRWHDFATFAQSRNVVKKRGFYIGVLSYVESYGHRLVAERVRSSDRILEIGAGGGQHIEFEKDKIDLRKYWAVDIDADFLEVLKKSYPDVNGELYDGKKLPYENDSFSTCLALSVLEHVCDLAAVLSEIRRVLRPGGDFLVIVPSNGNLALAIFKSLVTYPSLRRAGIRNPRHIWHYENVNCLDRIEALLNQHFSIVATRSVPFPFLPRALSPMRFFHCRKEAGAR